MAKLDAARGTAQDAMGRAIDDTLAGRPTYPSGTSFIRTEIDGFGEWVARDALRGVPIVIEYPDGEERYLVPRPHPRETTGRLRRLWLRRRS
jgi:hypothetical protein